jgi:hypothetical protein
MSLEKVEDIGEGLRDTGVFGERQEELRLGYRPGRKRSRLHQAEEGVGHQGVQSISHRQILAREGVGG